ncbi:MAG: response regulator, partial [Caldilineaceae bacterium]|nr:response regulator [Caldilineaceae bacterium]
HRPNLAIVDLMMPRMNGFELTRRLRATATLQHMPVIALSASAFDEYKEQSLTAGADFFLSKPIDFRLLLQIVEESFAEA